MTYVLYERRGNPMFCPIMNLFALAFADNAFKESCIKKPEDLFSFEIPHFKESLAIQWRPGCLGTPIFRHQVDDTICDSTPFTFRDFKYCIKRLGQLSGYPQVLTSYVLRRGTANAIDCTLLSARAERYHLLTLSRPTGHGSPAEPDNGPCTS